MLRMSKRSRSSISCSCSYTVAPERAANRSRRPASRLLPATTSTRSWPAKAAKWVPSMPSTDWPIASADTWSAPPIMPRPAIPAL